jgi:hypothetical protein
MTVQDIRIVYPDKYFFHYSARISVTSMTQLESGISFPHSLVFPWLLKSRITSAVTSALFKVNSAVASRPLVIPTVVTEE